MPIDPVTGLPVYDEEEKRVRDYIMAKYFPADGAAPQPDPFSGEEREKIQRDSGGVAPLVGEVLAGLGDVYSRAAGSPTNFQATAREASNQRRTDRLADFDRRKKDSKLKAVSDYLTKKYNIPGSIPPETGKDLASLEQQEELRRLALTQSADARKESAIERQEARTEKDETKKELQDEKMQAELAKRLGDPQNLVAALNNIDDIVGFKVDEYDPKEGTVGGKKKDLPGVSMPGIGRVSFFSRDARELQSAVAKVFNLELRDRSGAAVTIPELERLKIEFASGKFNSEPELIKALQNYKKILRNHLKNTEAGFKPEIVERYRERGGITSQDIGGADDGTVTVTNGQETLKIPAADLQDAEADGFRRI